MAELDTKGVTVNERLIDEGYTFAVRLERAKSLQTKQVLGILDELSQKLKAEMLATEFDPPTTTTGKPVSPATLRRQRARQEAFIQQGQATIDRHYAEIKSAHPDMLLDVAKLSARAAKKMIDDVFTFNITQPTLNQKDLRAMANDFNVQGQGAQEWWEDQDQATQKAYARELRMGVSLGEPLSKIVERIIGKPTGAMTTVVQNGKPVRVPEYAGGVMSVSRRDAEALVRTSAQTISNEALMATYRENDDLLNGVAALVTLDARTTLTCIARDGASWSLNGDPLPESPRQEPFPGPPPWHWQCRTVLTPITKSWADLVSADSGLTTRQIRALRSNGPSERASIDCRVPAKLDYESWLKGKSEKFQKEVLGKERLDLWKSGKITAAQLTDFRGDPLTIDELRELIKD